jgi:tRNA (guanine10-N2)-dimethyltransferase
MRKYLAHICGHFQPLGYEELYAVLEAESISYSIIEVNSQIVIFETNDNPLYAVSRCAFVHSLIELSDIGRIEGQKLEILQSHEISEPRFGSSFCSRVTKIGKKEVKMSTMDLERKLGDYIYNKYDWKKLKVNLKNPDNTYKTILIKNRFFLGLEIWSIDRKRFSVREPGKRDFFRPGAMRTDYARALVNLSRIKKNEIFFDPFCGGGGFLLEASYLGAYAIGSDLDFDAVKGSVSNMKQFKQYTNELLQGDSRNIPIKSFHAIATDPPYSLQSSTHGQKVSQLTYDFLVESREYLMKDRYLVYCTPAKVAPESIVEETNYQIVTLIDTFIHKSLTRRILVLK